VYNNKTRFQAGVDPVMHFKYHQFNIDFLHTSPGRPDSSVSYVT